MREYPFVGKPVCQSFQDEMKVISIAAKSLFPHHLSYLQLWWLQKLTAEDQVIEDFFPTNSKLDAGVVSLS